MLTALDDELDEAEGPRLRRGRLPDEAVFIRGPAGTAPGILLRQGLAQARGA